MANLYFRDWNPESKIMRYFDLDWYNREEDNAYWYIMQYTWLKDKKWVDIYEWDIVEVNTFEHWNIRMYVIYDAPSFFLSPNIWEKINVMKFSTPNVHETVIWNIYENINLLK